MGHVDRTITVEEARQIAAEAARAEFGKFSPLDRKSFLSPSYMEAEGCWFFFKSDDIEIPEGFLSSGVYAVSKNGKLRYVYDYRSNKQKMQDYLALFSLYAMGKREEADAALASFKEKYGVA